jgi:nicotinamide-nucleotide amidase
MNASKRPRAVLVISGSELVRGDRMDRNGPFLGREVLRLGFEPARIEIVGDREDELGDALRDGMRADLCIVSGGLGPTHDDRTVALVASAAGVPLRLDDSLHRQIGAVSRGFAERTGRPYADFEHGVRKQATIPEGAIDLGLAGTAPGLVLRTSHAVVVVLPGPPAELQRLWPRALETAPLRELLARAEPPERRFLRFFGASESAVAKALEAAGGDGNGVEATICACDFEIHLDLLVEPGAESCADELAERLRAQLDRYLFAEREVSIAELVLEGCREQGLTLATAESCTGGMIAERLTAVPGSSDVFVGGVVAYSNGVKSQELDVAEDLLVEQGAVSAETAAAMARGVGARLGADVAIGVTGIAGPGGATDTKPVGLVYLHVETPARAGNVELQLPGDRESIRRRATVTGLHLVRRLLAQNRDEPV